VISHKISENYESAKQDQQTTPQAFH